MNDKVPTVLIVDDKFENTAILEEILKTDYNTITAYNGKEALKKLEEADPLPKIVLLDIHMPEMTGREMFDIMKTCDKLKRVPVIFITTDNDSETESELLAEGAVDFINKPYNPDIVKLRIKNQIELKNYSDNLEEMVADKTEEATKTLDSALQGLANVVEHRDMESGEHVKRTQLYVKAIINYLIESNSVYAEELKLLQPDIIVKAMALHDVGKIAIPDRILLKPGKLDPDEYEIMKTHTIRGREIIHGLGDINNSLYLKHCEEICCGHHERWDGKGYPRGIKEKKIPLTARIASLADVYDALISARVYKSAMSYDDALQIIIDGKGTQFDPIIAEAVVQIKDVFKDISLKYK